MTTLRSLGRHLSAAAIVAIVLAVAFLPALLIPALAR